MKHDILRQRTDPVLAPNHLSVARPLRPEDLGRCVTQHDIYSSQPSSPGVPRSAYVRLQRSGPRLVSSSTEALDSDEARYVTRRIFQHARSMTTGPRSLPTNSPVPYFQSTDREYRSESGLSDRYSLRAPTVIDVCRSSHDDYATVLDDYATLNEASYHRETMDIACRVGAPVISTEVVPTTLGGMTPAPSGTGMIGGPELK